MKTPIIVLLVDDHEMVWIRLVLTSYLDDEKIYPVIEAGAFSYLLKTSRATEISQAIRAAMKDQPVLESQVASKIMNRFRQEKQANLPHHNLTEREMDEMEYRIGSRETALTASPSRAGGAFRVTAQSGTSRAFIGWIPRLKKPVA